MENKKAKGKKHIINETTIGMAQNNLIQKNGEAASQMIQAYEGVRYDSLGKDIGHKGRSLKGINNYRISDNYKSQNIKQQSGFSAELIKEARDNKKSIKASNPNRTRTTDGIGQGNHQQYDHVILDGDGNIIGGTGTQMKFLGINKNGRVTVVDKIANDPKWERYDGYIDIPEDQYITAIEYADNRANKLMEQARNLRDRGNIAKADELENKAKRYESSKDRIRNSNVKEIEAIEARLNPKKFVTEELLKDSHESGVETAKGAAILSGSISCAQNLYSILYEDKPIDDAIIDVTKTTVTAGTTAYGIGVSGTVIKSVMHTSKNTMTRRLGTTNAPVMIATGTVEVTKSITKYAKGEIDEAELFEELGEKGTGMVAAGFGAAIGAAAGSIILPGAGTLTGAKMGAFAGSMIAYTTSSILYNGALCALKDAKISEERRKVIEDLSKRSIEAMHTYQDVLVGYSDLEYQRREKSLDTLFHGIYESIINNNMDNFFKNINGIGKKFGIELEFQTFEEFDHAMSDDDFILII